jgi:hypothetical protein
MVTLILITTKVSDASRTIIYRANSPTIYARLNELEFHCIYCQPMLLVEFPLYILNYAKHARQMLKNKTKAWSPNPFKPSKLLLHWHPLPKWEERLRRPIVRVPPQGVHGPKKKWKHMHKSEDKNLEEIKLYWGSKIANKNRMTWWLNFQQVKIAIKRSNQKIQVANQIKILWEDLNNALNNRKRLPKVCAQHIPFNWSIRCTNMESSLPRYYSKQNDTKWHRILW